jgi:tetratricopeptide (TPR) repeat protein
MLKSRILDEPILVGREHELLELQSFFKSALEGKGTTVFVSGEAGSGKTKLVTDFLNSANQKESITTLTGWCLCDAGIPYFPFIEAFSAYYSKLNKTSLKASSDLSIVEEKPTVDEELEVNTWLKGPVRTGLSGTIEISPETWKDLTFAAIKKALSSISANKPAVLFLDDIQWADSASLALLQYISRTIMDQRVLILATFRSDDLKVDNEGRPHPLTEALRQMGRASLVREVKLSGLSQTDVGLLAEHMVGGAVQSSLAQKLETESQGNPLFVVESLRMLSEKNSLVFNRDKWCLSTDEVGIPNKIKDIILHRVSRLKPNQKKVLEVASVIGSKFDPELLATVLGMDSLEVIETLDVISQASSLVKCEGTYYRFDHVKSRDAIYDEVSLALKKAYHGRIAERLETNTTNKQVSDLAYHYANAGNKTKALKYSLSAGGEALSFVLGTEAIKHFKYVLDNTADEPEYVAQREIAREGLGDAFYTNSNGQAVEVFEQLSKDTTSNLVRARALRKAARAAVMQGNYGHALELVKTPIEGKLDDRLEYARFLSVKGMVEGYGAYVPEAKQDLEEALKVFEEDYSLQDIIDALTQLSIVYVMEKAADNSLGQPEKALASILRALALCEYTKNLGKQVEGNVIAFIIYSKCALSKEIAQTVKASFDAVQKIGDPTSRDSNATWSYWMSSFQTELKAMDKIFSKLPLESMRNFGTGAKIKFYLSSFLSGVLTDFRADLKTASLESLKGAECAKETDFFEILALNYTNLTRQYAELGQMEQAKLYYENMEKIFEETTLSGFMFAHAMHLFSKAVFFSSKHQWEEANKYYEETIRYYLSVSPSTGIEAGIRRGYCWNLLQQGRFDDAKRQFEESKKTIDELEKRLVHANIIGFVVAPAKVEVGKKFDVRMDLVNIGKNAGSAVEVKDFLPAGFKILEAKPLIDLKEGSFTLRNKTIQSFQDEAVTLTLQASETGVFTLQPQICYIDDLEEAKTCLPKPITITVKSTQPQRKSRESQLLSEAANGTKSESAEIDILKKFGLSR